MRLGKQGVSWGESTFIGGGINSINPIDVSAFRRPGAEIKEGLIPVNMFYVSQSLTENLSTEAFYQLEWDQTVTDNCGTFFSQPDVISDGCDQNLAVLRTRNGLNSSLAAAGLPAGLRNAAINTLAARGVNWGNPDEGAIVRRGPDRDALGISRRPYCLERGISASYLASYLNALNRYYETAFEKYSDVDFIGFSVWTSNLLSTLLAAHHLKRRTNPPFIVAGGPQLTESSASAVLALRTRP